MAPKNENAPKLIKKEYNEKLLELIIVLNSSDYLLSDSKDQNYKLDVRIVDLFDTVGADPDSTLNEVTVRKWRSRKNISNEYIKKIKASRDKKFDVLRNIINDNNGDNAIKIYNKLIESNQIPENVFKKIADMKNLSRSVCVDILVIYFYFCVISSIDPNDSEIGELKEKYELTITQSYFETLFNKYSKTLKINNKVTSDNDSASKELDVYVCPENVYDELTLNNLLNDQTTDNILLIGQSGSGKSYSLKKYIKEKGDGKFLYIPLEKYKKYNLFDLKTTSDGILFYIMYKCLWNDKYYSPDSIPAEDKKFIKKLEEEFSKKPIKLPNYTLLLDGYNNIPSEYKKAFNEELSGIINKWANVRIIITTTDKSDVCDDSVFKTLNFYIVTGIKKELPKNLKHPLFDDKTYELLKEFKSSEGELLMSPWFNVLKKFCYLVPKETKDLLKLPLIYNLYINNSKRLSFGEIFDNCITNYPGNDTIEFILQLVIPFLAKKFGETFSRAKLLSAIDKTIEIYIHNEHIFQGFFKGLNISAKAILESRNNKDWIDIILNKFPFIENERNASFSFTDRFLMHCFEAKHIVNAINALCYVKNEEISESASQLDINGSWFGSSFLVDLGYDDYEVCKLIGEISKDYKNNGIKKYYSPVNQLLDLCRKVDLCNGTTNALSILQISRKKKIVSVDFNSLFIMYLPSQCEYYDCNFSNCRLSYLPIIDYEDKYTYTQNDSIRIIIIENSCGPEIYIWDRKKDKLIDHYNYNEYSDGFPYYFTEFYKGASNTIILLSKTHILYFEFDIENHKGNITKYISSSESEYEIFHSHYLGHKDDLPDLSDEFLEEVITSYNIFHYCDFTEIKIDDKEQFRLLKKMIEKDENETWPSTLYFDFQDQ